MKLTDLFEIDFRGNMDLVSHAERRGQMRSVPSSARHMQPGGIWLVDRATGKRLAGPFKDDDAAIAFKTNRKDRIPADARIVNL